VQPPKKIFKNKKGGVFAVFADTSPLNVFLFITLSKQMSIRRKRFFTKLFSRAVCGQG
jgi:hypothetical protein